MIIADIVVDNYGSAYVQILLQTFFSLKTSCRCWKQQFNPLCKNKFVSVFDKLICGQIYANKELNGIALYPEASFDSFLSLLAV